MGSPMRSRAGARRNPIVLEDAVTVGIGAQVENALEAKRIVQMPRDGFVTLYLLADATGLRARFSIAEQDVLLDSAVKFPTAARGIDTDKDGVFARVFAKSGQRLILYFNNPTAGALVGTYRVTIE